MNETPKCEEYGKLHSQINCGWCSVIAEAEQRGYDKGKASITLKDAKRFFQLSDARAHTRCWRVRKEYLQ
jgi:hypothetical protein